MKNTLRFVKNALCDIPETRENDNLLILEVLAMKGVDINKPFAEVMQDRLPVSFECVTRARRKVQEKNPELRDEKTVRFRMKKQEEFRKFAKEL